MRYSTLAELMVTDTRGRYKIKRIWWVSTSRDARFVSYYRTNEGSMTQIRLHKTIPEAMNSITRRNA